MKQSFAGEGKNVEYKREIPKNHKNFLKDIIAFSNSSGGVVIIGAEENRRDKDHPFTVYGIGEASPFKMADDISNMIDDACTPQIISDIYHMTLEGETVLVVDVPPGAHRPYYLKREGKEASAYIRINGTSRVADGRILRELEWEGQRVYYDSMPEIGWKFNARKTKKLCAAMKKIALAACKNDEEREQVKELTAAKFDEIGLLCRVGKDYVPTHAFNLMTDNTIKYAIIQCALFKGTVRDVFIDRKEFAGPIYEQIDNAYQFVLRHINQGAEIDGLLRRDVYELPPSAIREAIVNAVAHRSYLDDACIQISIFDDRLEVVSPGLLYGGLDMETAIAAEKSKCRNIAIAESFKYMKIIEKWGTGLSRIINRCKEYGLKPPRIEEVGDSFKVTFYRKLREIGAESDDSDQENIESSLETEKSDQENIESSLETEKSDQENIKSSLETEDSDRENIKSSLETEKSDREKEAAAEEKLIACLRSEASLTQRQLAEKIGYSLSGVKKIIVRLKQNGILRREGATKKGRWIVSSK